MLDLHTHTNMNTQTTERTHGCSAGVARIWRYCIDNIRQKWRAYFHRPSFLERVMEEPSLNSEDLASNSSNMLDEEIDTFSSTSEQLLELGVLEDTSSIDFIPKRLACGPQKLNPWLIGVKPVVAYEKPPSARPDSEILENFVQWTNDTCLVLTCLLEKMNPDEPSTLQKYYTSVLTLPPKIPPAPPSSPRPNRCASVLLQEENACFLLSGSSAGRARRDESPTAYKSKRRGAMVEAMRDAESRLCSPRPPLPDAMRLSHGHFLKSLGTLYYRQVWNRRASVPAPLLNIEQATRRPLGSQPNEFICDGIHAISPQVRNRYTQLLRIHSQYCERANAMRVGGPTTVARSQWHLIEPEGITQARGMSQILEMRLKNFEVPMPPMLYTYRQKGSEEFSGFRVLALICRVPGYQPDCSKLITAAERRYLICTVPYTQWHMCKLLHLCEQAWHKLRGMFISYYPGLQQRVESLARKRWKEAYGKVRAQLIVPLTEEEVRRRNIREDITEYNKQVYLLAQTEREHLQFVLDERAKALSILEQPERERLQERQSLYLAPYVDYSVIALSEKEPNAPARPKSLPRVDEYIMDMPTTWVETDDEEEEFV